MRVDIHEEGIKLRLISATDNQPLRFMLVINAIRVYTAPIIMSLKTKFISVSLAECDVLSIS